MRNDFKDYARTFANYFCHFLPKTFLGFVLHIAEYRIDLYGIDEIAYRHFQNFGLFVLFGPIGCTNISRVVTISKIPGVQQNVIRK